MKRSIALLLVLLFSAVTGTSVLAGRPVMTCAAVNGSTFSDQFNVAVAMSAGETLTIKATGSGTLAIGGSINRNLSVPGSVSLTASSNTDFTVFGSLITQGSVQIKVTCGRGSGSSGSSEPNSPPCYSLYDGRINNSQGLDCAAPIAIYLHSIDIYGINSDGSGTPIMSINADILKGLVPESNTLLSEGTNILSGQFIRVYWLVKTAEVEVITAYPDGKPYIVVWPIAHPELLYHLAA